jgi:hypothetical protein
MLALGIGIYLIGPVYLLILVWLLFSRKTLAYFGWTFPPKNELYLAAVFGLLLALVQVGSIAAMLSEIASFRPHREVTRLKITNYEQRTPAAGGRGERTNEERSGDNMPAEWL